MLFTIIIYYLYNLLSLIYNTYISICNIIINFGGVNNERCGFSKEVC
jgi:hypothetical protein